MGRVVAALVVAALGALVLVALASTVVAGRLARDQVLSDAVRTVQRAGDIAIVPVLSGTDAGSPERGRLLDDVVERLAHERGLVAVAIWDEDRRLVYSDDHDPIGTVHAASEQLDAVYTKGAAQVSTVSWSETTDVDADSEVVEAYVPLTLDDGRIVAFEMYLDDDDLVRREAYLTRWLVPLAVSGLGLLVVAQLPSGVAVLRRYGRVRAERERLLADALAVSDRERRVIARDLHDGVVQDLAGAAYALDAAAASLDGDEGRDLDVRVRLLVGLSRAAVVRSVVGLRTLLIDIDPPGLAPATFGAALVDLVGRVPAGVDVHLVGEDLAVPLPPDSLGTAYRFVRECLANTTSHSGATAVTVAVTATADRVEIFVADNGVGLVPGDVDRRRDGHVGLKLLADAAGRLGGDVRLVSGSVGGTTAALRLPVTARTSRRFTRRGRARRFARAAAARARRQPRAGGADPGPRATPRPSAR